MVLVTASCVSVHSSSDETRLPDLIPSIYLSPPLYYGKGFEFRSYLNGLCVFSYFLQLKPEFC